MTKTTNSESVIVTNQKLTAAEQILVDHGLEEGYRFAPNITIRYPSQRVVQAASVIADGFPDDGPPTPEQVTSLFQALMGDQYAAVMEYLETFPVEAYPALFADLFVNVLSMVPRDMDADALVDSLANDVAAKWKIINPQDEHLFDD